jgi:hypothetical protein
MPPPIIPSFYALSSETRDDYTRIIEFANNRIFIKMFNAEFRLSVSAGTPIMSKQHSRSVGMSDREIS